MLFPAYLSFNGAKTFFALPIEQQILRRIMDRGFKSLSPPLAEKKLVQLTILLVVLVRSLETKE